MLEASNRSCGWFCALVAIVSIAAPLQAADSCVLVEEGTAKAVLVTDGNLSPSEKTAVEQFQRILKAMSGTELTQINADKAASHEGPQVWIGHDLVAKAYPDLKLDSLGDEGFIIRTDGDRLLLAGGKKRGTLYAMYTFMETLGYRFWMPTEEDIPSLPTVTVGKMDDRQTPGLAYRDLLYADAKKWVDKDRNGSSWGAANKRNGFSYAKVPDEWGGRINYTGNLVHSYAELMKPVDGLDYSINKEPECWALRNGKRTKAQPCLSNPKVAEIMTANVLKQLKEHPEYQLVVVGQNDNKSNCQCDECKALYEKYQSPAGAVVQLANTVAEEVEKVRPDVWVLAPAYQWSRKPPVGITPRKNVGTVLSSIECDFNRPWEDGTTEENKAFKEDVEGWSKIANRLYIWDYMTDFRHYLLPHPTLDVLGPNIRFLSEHKAQGVFCQGSHTAYNGEFAALRMWVLMKLLWNPKADAQALIKQFVREYYGPAAPHIQAYIDVLHSVGRSNPGMKLSTYEGVDAMHLTPDVIAESERLLRLAEKAAEGDPKYARRVRVAHLPILYVLLKRQPGDPTWKATAAKVEDVDPKELVKQFLSERAGSVSEGETSEHYYKWVEDYYGKQVTADSVPTPAELKDVPKDKYRLIQACQMDARARWWQPHEGASDGWVTDVYTVAWTVRHEFRNNGYQAPLPGKTYKLYARLKTSAPKADTGSAGSVGIWGEQLKSSKKLMIEDLQPDVFNVVEVGQMTADEMPAIFFISADKKVVDHIWLDCIWLVEEGASAN